MGRFLLLASLLALASVAEAAPPHLRQQGSAVQLIVDDAPFLIRGGELANSSASDLAYLKPHWADFAAANVNTILAPISWEIVEPEEGQFDWSSLDGLVRDARVADQRLVLLWFGSWKNSMSSYVPAWVKRDQKRFPRTQQADRRGSEILSPHVRANQDADARAFRAMMARLKAIDGEQNTVIMVQVENEMGMLPTARDLGPAANAAFAAQVPKELLDHLSRNRARLVPELRALWEANGARTSGSWAQVFGPGPAGEEVFTAWAFARYAEAVAAAGKDAYRLPMFVNAALNRPGRLPGDYPSGGPLPHLLDVWKAAAPSIDFLAPDIYFANFGEIVARYARPDNLLFLPEANQAGRPQAPSEALLAIGRYDAIGFSPFSIDTKKGEAAKPLARAYDLLRQLTPLILANRGTDRMTAFRPHVAFDGKVDDAPQTETIGGYRVTASFIDTWKAADAQQTDTHGALVIALGQDEYLVAGNGVTFTFESATPGDPIAGFESIREGRFENGTWIPGRWLNGDQSHQGRFVRLTAGSWGMQRIRLYRYR